MIESLGGGMALRAGVGAVKSAGGGEELGIYVGPSLGLRAS